jgi:hypothetical protein
MERQNLVVHAGLALSSLDLKGTEEWMKKNARKVDRYRAWMQSQAANPGAVGGRSNCLTVGPHSSAQRQRVSMSKATR